jgi:nitroreductase
MILELLKNRSSVRSFDGKQIPTETIAEITEAGRLSPSGGNEQPWLFGVITDRSIIEQIALECHGQKWIAEAPLLIVLCTVGIEDERGGRNIQLRRFPNDADAIRSIDQALYWELNQEEHQTKIAGANMALVALEHGIGSCWVSLFDVIAVSRLLNLPENALASEILVMGFPKRQSHPTPKKRIDQVAFFNKY